MNLAELVGRAESLKEEYIKVRGDIAQTLVSQMSASAIVINRCLELQEMQATEDLHNMLENEISGHGMLNMLINGMENSGGGPFLSDEV